MKRLVALAAIPAALSGCAVQLYGNQSTGGGASATATGSYVAAAAGGANARVAFSSGQPVAPTAPGGQLRVGNASAGGVLAAAIVIGELLNYIGAGGGPKPLPPETRISHTCSCYGYVPETRDPGPAARD